MERTIRLVMLCSFSSVTKYAAGVWRNYGAGRERFGKVIAVQNSIRVVIGSILRAPLGGLAGLVLGSGVFCEKKPYRKPVLNKVNLVAEEAVLGVCKNNTQAGPNQSGCIIPQCFNEGS